MPVKKPQIPDIPSYRGEDRNLQVWAERIKTAISHLTKTDFVRDCVIEKYYAEKYADGKIK